MQLNEDDLGKPSIKSKVTIYQAPLGNGKGANRPGYATLSFLAC